MTDDTGISWLDEAPWMQVALRELGTREAPGAADNPQVVGYFDAVRGNFKHDAVAWCAAFVCWVLEEAGYRSTLSARARSYTEYGYPTAPRLGAIVVLKRPPKPWSGHVGFYMGRNRSSWMLLGGNQNNAVSVAAYPNWRVIGCRWPREIGPVQVI